ncbi:MAG: cyclic pyranopterin monophosphate synthase MoaC [Planctomycetota bacterium]|jgi:cyclic pyranopterin phosphate synthase
MEKLSHVDDKGRAVMVDVSEKHPQLRIARAAGKIKLAARTITMIEENEIAKGDVLTVGELAGIQGAKRTAELIPLCHPLELTRIDVKASLDEDGVSVTSEVSCIARTGAEMEALTAVSVALLGIYDMCKGVDKSMSLCDIKLLEKVKKDASNV